MKIVISSGHGLHSPGARDIIDEVTEARRVTDRVAEFLRSAGVGTDVFHDNVTRPPNSTVNPIVAHHNGQTRNLDVSVHFNSVAGTRDAGIGVETLYRTGNAETHALASRVSRAIAGASGLLLRRGDGTWARSDLGFLNRTERPAILLEVCFVNSRTDVRLYRENFDAICRAIAETLAGRAIEATTPGLSVTPEELDILHRIVWAEARGEDALGQQLVVNVIMNRVNSPDFPDTIRDVVFQPGQFTPITNGAFDRATPDQRMRDAVQAALDGADNSRGALFFRTIRGAEGSWHEQALRPLFDHGGHRFYTTRERASVPTTATVLPSGFKEGDIVQFTGGGVFVSSTAATPTSTRGASRCTVTQANPGARNPLHLISEDGGGVWGWVAAADVQTIR